MAFTAPENAKILFYLGYPARTLDPTAMDYSSIVKDRLTGLPSDAELLARKLLSNLDKSRDEIEKAKDRLKAIRVEDIELRAHELDDRWKEDRRLVGELSTLLNIPSKGRGGLMVSVCV